MSTPLTDTITSGYTAPATINVAFLSDPGNTGELNFASFTDANGNSFDADGWEPHDRQQAELAFQQYAAVAGVTFNYVDDLAQADFVMVLGSDSEVGAPGYWNVGGGTITVDSVDYQVEGVGVFSWQADGWDATGLLGTMEIGSSAFLTLLDEIGRGLGLAHPHDTDGGSTVMSGVGAPTGDFGDFDLNQGVYTTMSLNDGWHTAPHGLSPSGSWGWQAGPMALDIAVLQEKYGVNAATNLGDSVYDMPQANTAGTFYQAIWDAGGTDTIRYGGSADAVLDLRAATLQYEAGGGGFLSYVDGSHGGVTIAHGVIVENATGGAGNDTLIGNAAGNVLTGGAGADALNGGSGSDTASYHSAVAPVSVDLADPTSNTGDAAGDSYVSIEIVEGSDFGDQLIGSGAADVLLGGGGADLMGGRDGADRVHGEAGNDRLYGAAGDDFVTGDGGNDRLFGGLGNDLLGGGDDDDRVYGEAGNDRLYDAAGNDVVVGGGGNDRLFGGDGDDLLGGGGDADRVYGEAGNDRLYGAAGDDILIGGLGNDRLFGGNGADLLGGGDGDDLLLGNAHNDRLFGAGGNDRLVGGAGNDRLTGNEGADLFVFQPNGSHDVVADFEDGFDQLDFRPFDFVDTASVLDLATQVGADVVFDLPGGATVGLTAFDINLLGSEDILI